MLIWGLNLGFKSWDILWFIRLDFFLIRWVFGTIHIIKQRWKKAGEIDVSMFGTLFGKVRSYFQTQTHWDWSKPVDPVTWLDAGLLVGLITVRFNLSGMWPHGSLLCCTLAVDFYLSAHLSNCFIFYVSAPKCLQLKVKLRRMLKIIMKLCNPF